METLPFRLTIKRLMAVVLITGTVCFGALLAYRIPDAWCYTPVDTIYMVLKAALSAALVALCVGAALVLLFRRRVLAAQLRVFAKYRHLLRLFVRRDFLLRFRKSVLGILWSLISPLVTMLIITAVFSYFFKYQIANFPVYLLSGQVIFNYYSESTSHAIYSLIGGQDIMNKVYVPKYIFPLSKVLATFINFALSLVSLFLVIIITRAPFYWTMLLMPVPILYTFLFSLGVSLLVSAVAVFFRDFLNLYSIVLTLLSYLTPLFYPVDILPPVMQALLPINPLYLLVRCFREVTVNGAVPDFWLNAACAAYAGVALAVGAYVFAKKQDRFMLYL